MSYVNTLLLVILYACCKTLYTIYRGSLDWKGSRTTAIYVNIHGSSERVCVIIVTQCEWLVLLGLRKSTRATNNVAGKTQNGDSNYGNKTNHTIVKAEMRKKMHLNSLVPSIPHSQYILFLHLRLSWFYTNHRRLDPSEKNEWKLTGKMNRMRNDRG